LTQNFEGSFGGCHVIICLAYRPHGGHWVISTLDYEGPPSGHRVISTLDYEGPPSGHEVVFLFFFLKDQLVATKWSRSWIARGTTKKHMLATRWFLSQIARDHLMDHLIKLSERSIFFYTQKKHFEILVFITFILYFSLSFLI
jgi:hypothetical protein